MNITRGHHHFKKVMVCYTRETMTMNYVHCRRLFFHVNYCFHQGDDDNECALIVVTFFNFKMLPPPRRQQ